MEAGRAVVANVNTDHALIAWASRQGRYERADRNLDGRLGTPFVLGDDGDRDEVIRLFVEHYLPHKREVTRTIGLRKGVALGCHCAPERCHAEWWAALANGEPPPPLPPAGKGKNKAPLPDRIEDGVTSAGTSPAGLLHPDVARVLDEFHRFNTPEARAAFAGRWVKIVAGRLEHTWPCIYELLVLIRDQELYKKDGFLHGNQKFPTFEAFFEEVLGKPFSTWAELEATYRFAGNGAAAGRTRRKGTS
jgi:hypothetical protein